MSKEPKKADVFVGARVRFRRKELGLSQGKLAEKLGITFQQVQKYEKGVNRVGASRLADMARILSVPVSYFFEDTERSDGSEGSAASMSNVLTMAGAADLLRAYSRISNPALRKIVLSLARSLASEESVAEPRQSRRAKPRVA
jgi:transcriptional regulator with XRE-family HTH domain